MEFWKSQIERKLRTVGNGLVVREEPSSVQGRAGLIIEKHGLVVLYAYVSEAEDLDEDEIAANAAQLYLGSDPDHQICVLNCGRLKGKLLLFGWDRREYFVQVLEEDLEPLEDDGGRLGTCLNEGINKRVMG